MSSEVRLLEDSEIAAACETLAASFDEDPLFRFMLPEERKRRRWLGVIMNIAVRSAFPDGAVVTVGEGPDAGVMAIAPPGTYPQPSGRTWGVVFRPSRRPRIPWPTWRLLRSGIPVLGRMGDVHPKEPHYYIQVVGVSPDRKGQGLGGRLMRHVVGLADDAGLPVYLETSNEVNLGFYARYGFAVTEELLPPKGAPPVWTMTRPASSSPHPA